MPSKTVPASTPSKCPKSALKESRCATTRIFCSPPRQTYVNHCEPKNVTRHRILQICSSGILAHLSIEVRCTSSSMVSLWPWMFGCDSRGPSFQSSSDSSSKIETMLPMCYNKKSLKKNRTLCQFSDEASASHNKQRNSTTERQPLSAIPMCKRAFPCNPARCFDVWRQASAVICRDSPPGSSSTGTSE